MESWLTILSSHKYQTMAPRIPRGNLLLPDILPKSGFRYPKDRGAPMILRSGRRDKAVVDAFSSVFEGKLRKRVVGPALAQVFEYLADYINDPGFAGIKADEGFIEWLCRRRATGLFELVSAVPENIWSVYFLFSYLFLFNTHPSTLIP